MNLKLRVSMAPSPSSFYQFYSLVQQCGGYFEDSARYIDLARKPVRERVQNEDLALGGRIMWSDET